MLDKNWIDLCAKSKKETKWENEVIEFTRCFEILQITGFYAFTTNFTFNGFSKNLFFSYDMKYVHESNT